ncbi:RNA polymerase sigma-54 factor RpoN [uncultured Candidatus Thioglobus sp.]|nr:RNA polymerase sigma-54 factor RpoN [uncultured Candidatus Thioglobus sp.]
MKLSLQVKIGKNLAMTPRLQQSIRFLQLSNIQLQTEIQQAVESNIMLEMAEDYATQQEDNATESELEKIDDSPDIEFIDSYESSISAGSNQIVSSSEYSGSNLESQISYETTLKEHLFWQLNLAHISEVERMIGTIIIDSLDDKGYLNYSFEYIRSSFQDNLSKGVVGISENQETDITLDEIESVLRIIQAMDPSGVGARDIQECLLLQLRQLDVETPALDLAIKLVSEHLGLLVKKDFDQIIKQLKISQEKLQQVLHLVQSTNPHPGEQIYEAPPEYIAPDVYVQKVNGKWRVSLNPDSLPNVMLNTNYTKMVRRADNSANNALLKNHLQEAKWFIKSLHERNATLLRVSGCIVERQQNFMEYGAEAMKPMVLHDVADALGLHESTISRITQRKYMHTSYGVFELKYFFSSQINTSYGSEKSSIAIRALIKKMISEEVPTDPLSDNKISALLLKQGIKVARRTVTKYRKLMGIFPSNARNRLPNRGKNRAFNI